MTYKQARRAEQLRLLMPHIDKFVNHYNKAAPTILFFPGGMASALFQATVPFSSAPPPYNYRNEWLSLDTFCSDGAEKLQMNGDREANDCITVPSGVIGFAGIAPYMLFQDWCQVRAQPFNYLLISWDWRRPLADTVDFVMGTVLPLLKSRITAQYSTDFLSSEYYFVGHSFGGMVVKLMLNAGGSFVDNVRRAITVATPFYGYGTSEHFYFEGFSYLNPFYSPQILADIIATFSGVYPLLMLCESLYSTVKSELAADPDAPLGHYPSQDLMTPATDVDPYVFDKKRYPSWVPKAMLSGATQTCLDVAQALPPSVADKLYNIRGIRTVNGQPNGAPEHGTTATQSWADLTLPYSADAGPDPISNPNLGLGDGVIPAWSARLLPAVDCDHVRSLFGDLDHVLMMDDPVVQHEIGTLIDGIGQSVSLFDTQAAFHARWSSIASSAEALAVLERVARLRGARRRRAEFAGLSQDLLHRVARRILLDLPNPPTAHDLDRPARRSKGPLQARARTSRARR